MVIRNGGRWCPRIQSNLLNSLLATAEGTLAGHSLEIDPAATTTVVMVSRRLSR